MPDTYTINHYPPILARRLESVEHALLSTQPEERLDLDFSRSQKVVHLNQKHPTIVPRPPVTHHLAEKTKNFHNSSTYVISDAFMDSPMRVPYKRYNASDAKKAIVMRASRDHSAHFSV